MATELGQIDSLPSSFAFYVDDVEADVTVVEGGVTTPTLTVNAENFPSGKTLNKLMVQADDGSYLLKNPSPSSDARGLFDGLNVWSLLLLAAFGVFSASEKKGGVSYLSLFLIALALIFSGPTVHSSGGGDNPSYQLTLAIPSGYKFTNLNLTLSGGGSVYGDSLSGLANQLTLDLCRNYPAGRPLENSFIMLTTISPSSTSYVCSFGPVNVSVAASAASNALVDIRSGYSNVTAAVKTTSNTQAKIRLLQSPRSWTRANGTTLTSVWANSCSLSADSLGHIGSCNFGPTPSTITITNTGSETFGYNAIQLIGNNLQHLCAVSPSRQGDVDWSSQILHAAFDKLEMTADETVGLDNAVWMQKTRWRTQGTDIMDLADGPAINVSTWLNWDALPFWAVVQPGLSVRPDVWLGLKWNAEYSVSFSWQQDPVVNANALKRNQFLNNVTIMLCDLPSFTTGMLDNASVSDSRCAGYTTYDTRGLPGWNTSDWLRVEDVRVQVDRYITNPYLLIQFNINNSINTQQADALRYFMKNITFRSVPKPYPKLPSPLTKLSELVNIPLPAPMQTPVARTDCPHWKSGLKLWHDPATWGGALPNPSAEIQIPANTSVLITSCSLLPIIYYSIVVPQGSELIFDDDTIALHINTITVYGKLWIGSETCRVYGPVNIVFHGTQTDLANDVSLTKGIQALGGTVDMHGKQYDATWSRLARNALPGDDRVTLFQKVNWEYGQQVVISTSIYKDDTNDQNEVMTVKSVDDAGTTVQFTSRLQYGHYGGQEYQSEVGLLSRRIVLSSAATDDTFGGHVIITPNVIDAEGRFSGVETRFMGQQNVLARYPLHFHLIHDCSKSYIQDSSFVSNFYRCAVFHGSTLSRWSRNVAFNATGHCFYIESGIEENNTVEFNLAVKVTSIGTPMSGDSQGGDMRYEGPGLRQPADSAAAGFYITNAYNTFVGNAASGGWSGFSFPGLPKSLFGAQADPNFAPNTRPLLEFRGNSAHSSGYVWPGGGSCIYIGGYLTENATDNYNLVYNSGRIARGTVFPNGTNSWMHFSDTKMFLCQNGMMHWGDRVEIENAEAHDTVRSATVFGEAWMSNAIVNGQSNNPFLSNFPNHQGNQFYDTSVKTILTRMKYRNYQPAVPAQSNPQNDNQCLISMTHSDVFKPQGISATRAWTFTNVGANNVFGQGVQDTGSSRFFNFVDWDGTAVQKPGTGAYIVGSQIDWWRLDSSCWKRWLVWICPRIAGREVGYLDIRIPGLVDNSQQDPTSYIGNMYQFGYSGTLNRSTVITRNHGVTGATGKQGWYMHLYGGSPSTMDIWTGIIPDGTYIPFAIRYPQGTTFTIKTVYPWWAGSQLNQPVNSTDSVAKVMADPNGRLYYFSGDLLYLKLMIPSVYFNNDLTKSYFERDGVRIYNVNNGYKYNIVTNCGGGFCTYQDPMVPAKLP